MTIENHVNQEIPQHGGDVYQIARSLGLNLFDLMDFSANINPLGFPPGIVQAVQTALPEIVHYPDRRSLALTGDLATFHQVSTRNILVGNGSTELIYLIARVLKPKKALIVAPAFSEYEEALRLAGVPVDFFLTQEEDNFTLARQLEPGGADLVFLANPASPSGALIATDLIRKSAAALDQGGVYLVLDEAFIDFVEEASLKSYLAHNPRLIILRSFTKFFGIPGIRLGYLLAAPELVDKFAAQQEPWSVNTLAQAMGRACLTDREFMAATRDLVSQERAFLLKELQAIPGLRPFPSAANYILVKITPPGGSATRLRQAVLARHIVVRDAGNFRGLDERFFRLAVRRREENQKLLEGLKKIY